MVQRGPAKDDMLWQREIRCRERSRAFTGMRESLDKMLRNTMLK
jgi:hypothetical protein